MMHLFKAIDWAGRTAPVSQLLTTVARFSGLAGNMNKRGTQPAVLWLSRFASRYYDGGVLRRAKLVMNTR